MQDLANTLQERSALHFEVLAANDSVKKFQEQVLSEVSPSCPSQCAPQTEKAIGIQDRRAEAGGQTGRRRTTAEHHDIGKSCDRCVPYRGGGGFRGTLISRGKFHVSN